MYSYDRARKKSALVAILILAQFLSQKSSIWKSPPETIAIGTSSSNVTNECAKAGGLHWP